MCWIVNRGVRYCWYHKIRDNFIFIMVLLMTVLRYTSYINNINHIYSSGHIYIYICICKLGHFFLLGAKLSFEPIVAYFKWDKWEKIQWNLKFWIQTFSYIKWLWKWRLQCDDHLASALTLWGRGTYICVSKLTVIDSDNGLSPSRRQAIIWTNAGILLIGSLVMDFSDILIKIHIFPLKKMQMKMSSGYWRPFCLGLNMLMC